MFFISDIVARLSATAVCACLWFCVPCVAQEAGDWETVKKQLEELRKRDEEKSRIIESIPKLKQSQIDELIRIFEEERRKFAELGQEHVPQLEKLAQQHYEDWMDIEMRQEQAQVKSSDEAKAEEIRKQLGL